MNTRYLYKIDEDVRQFFMYRVPVDLNMRYYRNVILKKKIASYSELHQLNYLLINQNIK